MPFMRRPEITETLSITQPFLVRSGDFFCFPGFSLIRRRDRNARYANKNDKRPRRITLHGITGSVCHRKLQFAEITIVARCRERRDRRERCELHTYALLLARIDSSTYRRATFSLRSPFTSCMNRYISYLLGNSIKGYN